MTELLQQLSVLIEDIIRTIGYPGVAAVMFAENVFPPIPSELIMPFAGFLVGQDPRYNFYLMWLAGTIGTVLGALVLYYIGWWAGDTVIRNFLRRYGRWITVSEADYDRSLRVFGKYGSAIVFFGRLVPLVRSIISLPAGANHMPMPQFLLYTTLGSAIWTGLLTFAGLQLGENWEQVAAFVGQYQDVVKVIVVAAVVLLGGWFIVSRIRARRVSVARMEIKSPEAS